MKLYIVVEEVTWANTYEIAARSIADARNRYGVDGEQVRGDIIDSTDPVITEEDEVVLCSCEHPYDEHQTGEGPWTGFCADHECKCESPVRDHPDEYPEVSLDD